MQIIEADFLEQTNEWLNSLIGKELLYITGRNSVKIDKVDISNDDPKIVVLRGSESVNIKFERVKVVISHLLSGKPVHIDTVFHSGSNDRSIIETILANLPPIGYMKRNSGRNNTPNKVLQLLDQDVHELGETLDISDELYTKNLIANLSNLSQLDNVSSNKLSKPFLLLAGISGTGKTRFVREQVKSTGSLNETYCLTSVRPDWHEPSDLLGYVSRLKAEAEYVSTDVIKFIARAWRAIIDNNLTVIEEPDEHGHNRLVVKGDTDTLSSIRPYWLCLDEMNLAPVEQYFADYLSVIETRKWEWQGSDFIYGCDAILSASTINHSDYSDKLRKQLGFEDVKYNNSWLLFRKYGISIPFNLIVAGTVNMDETTHGFSRKVIDRALSFDFGEFFPNEIDDFFEPTKLPKPLSYPIYSQAKRELFESVQADNDAQKTSTFFKAVNEVLKGTAFELAFRAFNELCLSVISFAPENNEQLAAVFDDFLMCKVLPRIEGDEDKLTTSEGKALLPELQDVIATELNLIWEGERLDYLRQLKDSDDKTIKVPCRSKVKLERMLSQLNTGFTSFWP